MNDLWKKENLHQALGSQGVVWTTQPNPFKEGEAAQVADVIKLEDGCCSTTHYWS